MLPMLELGVPKGRPISPENGINIDVDSGGNWVLRREDKKLKKAPEDGVYTVGPNQFKVRKGNFIPAKAENFIAKSKDPVKHTDEVATERMGRNRSKKATTSEKKRETTSEKKAENTSEE